MVDNGDSIKKLIFSYKFKTEKHLFSCKIIILSHNLPICDTNTWKFD